MEKGFFHPARGYWQAIGGGKLSRYPEGTVEVPLRPSDDHQWVNGAWQYVAPTQPTAAELDALATQVADQTFEQDAKMKALGLVMADIIEQAFGVSQAVARQQVKTRFRDYYRSLI